jgi:CubicO group peptidase (beta-lactamase class C family)
MQQVKPEAQGFSSERLARIGRVMQRYVDERKVAGTVTLVARRGQVVHFEPCGMAHIEVNQPMARDTIFRIYSMTKPITSVAVLMLLEEALIRLSDPVADYLPAFRHVKVLDPSPGAGGRVVEPERPITIHHLLTHTSGLSYGWDDNPTTDALYRQIWEKRNHDPDFSLNDWVEMLAGIPLLFQPGTRYRYGMSTDVLGALVQAVSGQPFEQFLQERIFAPLGMVDTAFHVPAEKIGRFAANYGPAEDGAAEVGAAKTGGLKVIDVPETSRYAKPTRSPSGGGGLVSTTSDYLRFAQMLLNRGELDGVRLLGRKTVELMTTNALSAGVYFDNDPASYRGFGLGVSVLLDVGRSQQPGSVGVYGWGGAANTNFWIDPHEELIGIVMLQFMPSNTYPVIADFRNLVYQALIA